MKFTKNKLSLEEGIQKEWIITNGIGGFSFSTILGANTRKYHGLLVAPLTPPARRHLILSKVDESIEINNQKHNLYTNMCKNYISDGYKYLESFEKEYIPVFTYNVQGVKIEKSICMEYGRNTVCVLYKIKNIDKKSKLILAPIVNFRDFHCMNTNHEFDVKQEIEKRKVKIVVDKNSNTPIYMNLSEGTYIEHINDSFKDMFYIEEEKRGFFPEENHVVTGRYEVEIMPNEEKEITFVCSLEANIEEIDANKVIKKEIDRLDNIVKASELPKDDELIKDLVLATDNFIVYRPSFGLHTVIAGYPWFLDWGRDTLISFEGLLLVTKRFDIAKEVLLTFKRDIKYGLVPNGYSGFDNRPLYNSVDSSLLLFEQIEKYIRYTGDYEFVEKNFYNTLKLIVESYKSGIDIDDNNIYLDKDYLLVSGTEKTQNTWMDAKYGDFAVTPRNGKAVEINSMWYNALKILEKLCNKFESEEISKYYGQLAEKCKKAFKKEFYCKEKETLYDVIGDSKIRPNQLFALALTYPVIDPNTKVAKAVFETVTKKLLKKNGLKTLAKGEKNYVDIYEGDSFKRDMSYHQGITWPWLLGIYYDAFKKIVEAEKSKSKKKELEEKYSKFVESVEKTFKKALYQEGAIGSISELYDSKTPYLPKGAVAQAWSVAEVLRIIINK